MFLSSFWSIGVKFPSLAQYQQIGTARAALGVGGILDNRNNRAKGFKRRKRYVYISIFKEGKCSGFSNIQKHWFITLGHRT